jgi:hypothetical protein
VSEHEDVLRDERKRIEEALRAVRPLVETCAQSVVTHDSVYGPLLRQIDAALAPSAPEPAPAPTEEPWVQCTDHMNLAKPRCLGGCRTRAEHERYNAKPEPAQDDRACHTGERR